MAADDFDAGDVDKLIKELAARPKPPAPKPTGRPVLLPMGASIASAVAPPPAPAAPGRLARGRTWTTARMLMPATRTDRTKTFELPSGVRLPGLPAWFSLPTWPALPSLRDLPRIALQELIAMQWNTVSVRGFVGLGVLLSLAMPFWPYSHAWSWGLLLYLLVIELVVITGIWGAKLSWDARLPAAHTVAIGTLLWGLGLLVLETVPRFV